MPTIKGKAWKKRVSNPAYSNGWDRIFGGSPNISAHYDKCYVEEDNTGTITGKECDRCGGVKPRHPCVECRESNSEYCVCEARAIMEEKNEDNKN
jgi:hypothetical protein